MVLVTSVILLAWMGYHNVFDKEQIVLYSLCSYTQYEELSHSDYPQFKMLLITLGIHCKVYTSGGKGFFPSFSLSPSPSNSLSPSLPSSLSPSPSPSLPEKLSNQSVQISIVKERFFSSVSEFIQGLPQRLLHSITPHCTVQEQEPRTTRGQKGREMGQVMLGAEASGLQGTGFLFCSLSFPLLPTFHLGAFTRFTLPV